MAFKDPRKDAADEGFTLPLGGVTYRIPPLSADVGPTAQHIIDAMLLAGRAQAKGQAFDQDDELLDDLTERDLYERVLGPVLDEMAADGVTWSEVKRAALTAMAHGCYGSELAEQIWNGGEDEGKANRATRRAAARTASGTSKGSRAGTTSPARTRAPRSGGPLSSSTGPQ